jgi:hypothetical protein
MGRQLWYIHSITPSTALPWCHRPVELHRHPQIHIHIQVWICVWRRCHVHMALTPCAYGVKAKNILIPEYVYKSVEDCCRYNPTDHIFSRGQTPFKTQTQPTSHHITTHAILKVTSPWLCSQYDSQLCHYNSTLPSNRLWKKQEKTYCVWMTPLQPHRKVSQSCAFAQFIHHLRLDRWFLHLMSNWDTSRDLEWWRLGLLL